MKLFKVNRCTTLAAVGAFFGSVIMGGQVVYAGLVGYQSAAPVSPKAAQGAPGMPTEPETVEEWWEWFLRLRGDRHPIRDEIYCGQKQDDDEWFLVSGTFDRECEIPAETNIVIPIINAECSTLEKDPFGEGEEDNLTACAAKFFADGDAMSLTVDGEEVVNNPLRFRTRTDVFDFTLADPAPPNVDVKDGVELPAVGESAADGYYVTIVDLSEGEHVIEFSGTLAGGPFAGFTQTGKWRVIIVDDDNNDKDDNDDDDE